MKQISELSGFSLATVSNALNGKKGVNAQTSKKILEIASNVGYLDNARISGIKIIMYQKNGKILNETPLISALFDGVEIESRRNGFDTTICYIRESDYDFETQLSNILNERNYGILLLATEMEQQDIKRFASVVVPFVVVDAWFEDESFDTVLMNNTDSVHRAIKYLIDHGHREIGCLRSKITIRNFHYRRLGLINTLAQYGLALESKFCVDLEPTINGAYEDMKQFLSKPHMLPTAYYVDNDVIALGAMKAMIEYGYKIPNDVSIIGFDNHTPLIDMASPPLTTMHVPKRELGILAASRLIEQIKSASVVPARIEVLTELIVRESVKTLHRNENEVDDFTFQAESSGLVKM